LGELIGGTPATIGSAATISSTGFVRLSPDLIGLPPDREAHAQNVAAELVESVRVHGILQPILVRRRTQGYEVVVGARRLVAARLAGLKEVPAMVIQATDEEVRALSKVENTCRESGSPMLSEAAGKPERPVPVPTSEAGVSSWWTPGWVAVGWGVAILLVMGGIAAGIGVGWRVQGRGADLQVRELVVAQPPTIVTPEIMVAPPVVVVPPVQKQPELDVSEFKVLEDEGVSCTVNSNGVARLVMELPVFSSRTTLAEEGTVLLNKLGAILSGHEGEWTVVVTGHTDAMPLRGNAVYRDNQELGLARAVEVVRYLMREAKVPAVMLRAATAGEDNPPFPGDDAELRRKNRTVTFWVALRQ
jgi:hypothetical protein